MSGESVYSPDEIVAQVEQKLAFLATVFRPESVGEDLVLNDEGREGFYWILNDMKNQLGAVFPDTETGREG